MNEDEKPVVVELLDDTEQAPVDVVSIDWLDPDAAIYKVRRRFTARTRAPFYIS
jgi:hypothetical protein